MPAPIAREHRRSRLPAFMLGLGACAAAILLGLGLFQKFSPGPPPEQQVAPQAKTSPDRPAPAAPRTQAVEVSPGTATDGHFVIRLLGGTSSR